MSLSTAVSSPLRKAEDPRRLKLNPVEILKEEPDICLERLLTDDLDEILAAENLKFSDPIFDEESIMISMDATDGIRLTNHKQPQDH